MREKKCAYTKTKLSGLFQGCPGGLISVWNPYYGQLQNCPESIKIVQIFPDNQYFPDSFQIVWIFPDDPKTFQTVSKLFGSFQMTFKSSPQFQNCPHISRDIKTFLPFAQLSSYFHMTSNFPGVSKQRNCYADFVRKVCVREKLPFFVFLCPWRHLIFV